jgi:hypothetical protein
MEDEVGDPAGEDEDEGAPQGQLDHARDKVQPRGPGGRGITARQEELRKGTGCARQAH